MSEPKITITLGRSGQKVVKRPWTARNNSETQSRSKRSLQDDSFLFSSKRARGHDSVKSSVSFAAGSRLGRNDLRRKLISKRMSESPQTTEIHGAVSRGVQSVKNSEGSSVRSIPSSSGVRQRMDSLTRAYTTKALDELGLKSTGAISEASPPVADVRYMNEMGQGPSSRLRNVSGSGRVVSSGVVKPSPSKIPVPLRPILDARKKETAPPIATSTILRSSQANALPLTINTFLHSLGLEKYAINFQAEEIDMTVLKQMGDRDLKELGLPMGPRKKILLAMIPPARRPSA